MASSRLRSLSVRLATLALLGPLGRFIISFLVDLITLRKEITPREEGDIKVIACGFFRSGTHSLKLALDRLGFKCYHGVNFFADHGEHAKLMLQAATEAKWDKWQQILQGYSSIADFPATLFYKQLMAAYPNAKVILNVRDPDRWHHSCMQTVFWLQSKLFPCVFQINHKKFFDVAVWQGLFEDRFEDKEFAIKVYKSHVEEVKRIVPKEKFLLYESKDGWAPLCKFLEVEIPDTPFPHGNDTSTFRSRHVQRERLYAAFSAAYVGVVWSALALLLKWLYQFSVGSYPQLRTSFTPQWFHAAIHR